jgi:long-subunit fatty acid transport protein
MGGAFIGVADDATAASWNPAGLIQLETPEVSVVGAYNYRKEDTTYDAFPEASGEQSVSTYDLNYLSAAYPFSILNTNMIASLNLQHLYDFKKEVGFSYRFVDEEDPPLTLNNNVNYEQDGDFKPLSPALAVQITPRISLGFTLNVWDHGLCSNKWNSNYRSYANGTFVDQPLSVEARIDESYKMDGLKLERSPSNWHNVNFNLGFMWNINHIFTLGAVVKSPFEAHLDHERLFDAKVTLPMSRSRQTTYESDRVILDMPMSYGAGLAARLSDALTFDLDVYRTNWSDYVLHTAGGAKLNPITGGLQSESDIDDTTQVRLGGEYLFIRETMILPVRAGLFYDPEPADGSPDDFWGGTIGGGVAYKRFVYDIAYQYRFGRDVRTVSVGDADSNQDVDQHTVYMSVIFHF